MIDLSAWPALILTAGKATRLHPLSSVRAKAAMPVAGTPIVVRILEWLRAAGVRRVVMNLHHRPETITRVVGDGSAWDTQVRYSWEPEILGSAGGPRRALPLLDADRFLIVNGDTLTDCHLAALVQRHRDSGALATMAVVPGDIERYGGVIVGRGGAVHGFARATRRTASAAPSAPVHRTAPSAPDNRTAPDAPGAPDAPDAPVSVMHFIGVQAVERDAFAGLPDDAPSEIVRTLYPQLIASQPGSIAAYTSGAEFFDVGTARDYLDTVSAVAVREGKPFDRGESCQIAPDALVTDSVLWDRVSVGRGASLSRCIVADDVTVPDGARYENVVLVGRGTDTIVVPI